jgi:probable HAF family extracellular repeat protein
MTINNPTSFLKVSSTSRSAAKKYSVTNIRPVNKGGYSTASMINSFGQAVGHGAAEPNIETRAYAWSSEHGLVADLGSVYGGASFATDINDKGVIVGYMATRTGSLRAYLLGQGQMYDLGLLSPVEYEEAFSIATDINESGQIVGYSTNNNNSLHAYIWNHEGGMTDLGTLGKGRSYAYGINENGVVVGWSEVDSIAAYRAFSWTKQTGMTELPGGPSLSTVAYGVNGRGTICGAAMSSRLSNALQAVIWTGDRTVELGSLITMSFSSATAINDVGQVVGWSYPTVSPELQAGRAVIWDIVQGMQDLNDLIGRGTGWLLHKATGINNDGEIVGCGSYEGKQQSFLLTPEDYARNVKRLVDLQQLNLIINQKNGVTYRTIMIRNTSHKKIKGPIHLIFKGLPAGVTIVQSRGEVDGHQFRTVNTDHMSPGSQMSTTIQFLNPNNVDITYELDCYAGSF